MPHVVRPILTLCVEDRCSNFESVGGCEWWVVVLGGDYETRETGSERSNARSPNSTYLG